jgi:CHASE2 domain-containing sensor protein
MRDRNIYSEIDKFTTTLLVMKKAIIRGATITAFVFLMMKGFESISKLNMFTAFDPISQALGEFELTDWVFSKFREQPEPDPRIVLVNIGPNRAAIAQQINTISSHGAKVIGIDSFFNCEGGFYDTLNCPQLKDTLANLMLSGAIAQAGNVVLVSKLMQTDSLFKTDPGHVFDSLEYSDPMFSDFATNAFANLPSNATYQEDVKVCKTIFPQMMVNGERKLAFSVQMAWMYDSVKAKKFLERGKEEEIINFRGNINITDVKLKSDREQMANVSEFNALCFAVDWDQLERGDYDSTMFKNAVVIIGYLGDYFGDPAWEDKFFSPLNTKVAGRANPDMFGPVIHANVVAMILNEDYVNEIPEWMQIVIAVLLCFLNVILFAWIDDKFPFLYDGLSVILQIVQLLLISLLIIYVFAYFNLKLELALSMGSVALIGPCFDIYKSLENTFLQVLTSKKQSVLTAENQEIH